MKFSQTSTAKDYGLTINDVDFEVIEPGNLTDVPTVLIIPHDDSEFPIEPIEVGTVEDANKLIKELQEN